MSFAITVYVREGIVMAADSRLTLSRTVPQAGGPVVQLAVGQTDSNQKLFLARNDVGIATYGDADIKGVPIAGFIESFLETALPEVGEVEDTAKALLGACVHTCSAGCGVASWFRARLLWGAGAGCVGMA